MDPHPAHVRRLESHRMLKCGENDVTVFTVFWGGASPRVGILPAAGCRLAKCFGGSDQTFDPDTRNRLNSAKRLEQVMRRKP